MIRAIFYALRYSASHEPLGRVWGRISGFFSVIFSKRVALAVTDARLAVCAKCPIYCADLKTCGDARNPTYFNDPNGGGLKMMGCACYLKTKARLAEATCWLDDNSFSDLGPNWPK